MEKRKEEDPNLDGLSPEQQEVYKKLDGYLKSTDIITGAFTTQQVITAVQMLVDPGDVTDLLTLAMRADFKDDRELKAIARHMAKCIRFGYDEGLAELKFYVAGRPGLKGKRSDMLVQAVIGEKKQQSQQSEGFGDKVKRALHI